MKNSKNPQISCGFFCSFKNIPYLCNAKLSLVRQKSPISEGFFYALTTYTAVFLEIFCVRTNDFLATGNGSRFFYSCLNAKKSF